MHGKTKSIGRKIYTSKNLGKILCMYKRFLIERAYLALVTVDKNHKKLICDRFFLCLFKEIY